MSDLTQLAIYLYTTLYPHSINLSSSTSPYIRSIPICVNLQYILILVLYSSIGISVFYILSTSILSVEFIISLSIDIIYTVQSHTTSSYILLYTLTSIRYSIQISHTVLLLCILTRSIHQLLRYTSIHQIQYTLSTSTILPYTRYQITRYSTRSIQSYTLS